MNLHAVVKKLVGPVKPVGESHTDSDRLANLYVMCDLLEDIVTEIDQVAKDRDSHQASIRIAGEAATKCLSDLGIEQ